MSNWNSNYTQRKQKEMVKQAIKEDRKNPLKPLYPPVRYGTSYYTRKHQQAKHDKFCWRVGFSIIALLTGLFIWVLVALV